MLLYNVKWILKHVHACISLHEQMVWDVFLVLYFPANVSLDKHYIHFLTLVLLNIQKLLKSWGQILVASKYWVISPKFELKT